MSGKSEETLAELIYRAVYDAFRVELEESVDVDDVIRDVARGLIEDRAEQRAAKMIRPSKT